MDLFQRDERQKGFTLVELVTVLVIVGVLAVAAIPRFLARNDFDSRAFHDQVISTLRFAQKIAISQRRFVCVVIKNSVITLTYDATPPSTAHTAASCPGTDLINPATGQPPYTLSTTSTAKVLDASFSFDALGSTVTKQTITISSYTPDITVEPGTGYVH
jgi:MSHA pilin protein MshC